MGSDSSGDKMDEGEEEEEEENGKDLIKVKKREIDWPERNGNGVGNAVHCIIVLENRFQEGRRREERSSLGIHGAKQSGDLVCRNTFFSCWVTEADSSDSTLTLEGVKLQIEEKLTQK